MKDFLITELGNDQGCKIYDLQQERLSSLLNNTKDKSENQMKTLTKTIMPRIALYQILLEIPLEQPEPYKLMEKYMFTVVCAKMGKQIRLFEKLPYFYKIFRKMFISGVQKSDNWITDIIHSDDEYFTVHVHKCLWYDACVENNCEELCRIFCECDNVNFDPLRKVEFIRKGSIGLGQDLCDFTFRAGK